MRPYRRSSEGLFCSIHLQFSLVILFITNVFVTFIMPAEAAAGGRDLAALNQSEGVGDADEARSFNESGTRHFYSMEYAAAEKDFQRAIDAQPEDAASVNHLLNALLFDQLNHTGALNTSLYASDKFLALKKQATVDPNVANEIKNLDLQALELSNKRLAANANDETALYNRGVTKGIFATYQALIEHSWFAALRSAMAARHDHQRVLELDPQNNDAKMIVGMHTYIAGSLPWAVKVAASMIGFSGSKERGIKLLREAADANGESSVDAKVALALFLRREQRYDEALKIVQSLTSIYPKNFLFALEEANLLKDMGRNQDALDSFEGLISDAHRGRFHEPRLEFAYYGLGEMLRGRHQFTEAAEAFDTALDLPRLDPDIRQRCALSAGEMHDTLNDRPLAVKEYQIALAGDTSTPTAQLARRYLREPYRAQ